MNPEKTITSNYKRLKKRRYRQAKRAKKRMEKVLCEAESSRVTEIEELQDPADEPSLEEGPGLSLADKNETVGMTQQAFNDRNSEHELNQDTHHLYENKKCIDSKETEQRLKDQVDNLQRSLKKKENKIEKLERSNSFHQFYYRMAKGFESKIMFETMEEFVSERTLQIAGTATHEGRLGADVELLRQGVVIIHEDEITASEKIGNGARSFVFKAKFKGMDVATKCYLGQPEIMVKEYQILNILSSHPNIPYPYGLVTGRIPQIVTSYSLNSVPLASVKPDCEQKLAKIVSGVIKAVSHIHHNGILHNNIHHNNVVVDANTGTPTLIGFSHACLQKDAYVIPQVSLDSFGKDCCLPSKVKDRLQKVSVKSDLFCLGFTIRWHLRKTLSSSNELCQSVSSFAAECMGLVQDRRMSDEKLEEALARFSVWAAE